MLPADLVEHVGTRCNVEQLLVSLGILDNRLGFAVDGENDGTLAPFELPEEDSGLSPERGQRLNVFNDTKRGLHTSRIAPLKVPWPCPFWRFAHSAFLTTGAAEEAGRYIRKSLRSTAAWERIRTLL